MELKDYFAKYILNNCKEPKDWKESGGKFPPKFASMRNYCKYLLLNSKDQVKQHAIRDFFYIEQMKPVFEAVDMINTSGRTKTIEKFFKGNYTPDEQTLNFVAIIFDLPIKSIKDFELSSDNPLLYKVKHLISVFKKINQRLSKGSWLYLLAAILSISFLVSFVYRNFLLNKTINSQSSLIKELSFNPDETSSSELVTGNNFNKVKELVIEDTTRNTLVYHTNNIYNTDYLLPKENSWSFPTDSSGEDIYSVYGAPYNKIIQSTTDVNTKNTIANQAMKIRFNIYNQGNEALVIDNIFLDIKSVHNISESDAFKGRWSTKSIEDIYEINLLPEKRLYPLDVFINLASGEQKYFAFKITTGSQLKGKAIRFMINLSGTDGKGNRTTISSDKVYVIGSN